MRLLLILSLLLCGACATQLQQDPAASPIDVSVSEGRIEFNGCGQTSQLGMIACVPSQTLSIVTEFPGDVLYFSSATNPGINCSMRQQVRATPPLTAINLAYSTMSVCDVTVYYLPQYPATETSVYPIMGLYGQVSMQPDTSYAVGGNYLQTTAEILAIKIPGAQHGEYEIRSLNSPLTFTGDTISYRPVLQGFDLIQVKYWDQNNAIQHELFTANYFAPMAIQLRFDQAGRKLTYPASVSIISINGSIHRTNVVTLPDNFTGYVRAYTIQGRTLVSYFSGGTLQWNQ
jgi:hypothetical protein